MQDIFGCASSTAPFGRIEGCSVSPCGQPLYSRHAKTPHEERICFSPEESNAGLWTYCVCLLLLLQPPEEKEAPATLGWPERGPQGQQRLLRSWNSWKAAACPTRAIPPGHNAICGCSTGRHSSLGGTTSSPALPHGNTTLRLPPGHLAESLSCPTAGCLRWCNPPPPMEPP